jgi:hypothetical protein
MDIYVIWRTDYDNSEESHIIGIHKNKTLAINECKKYKKVTMDKDSSDGLLGEFSTINNKDKYFCTKLNIEKTDCVYFIKINESGGGGSYHEISWIYGCSSLIDAINIALDFFENEHNVDEDCEDCQNDACRKKLVNELKKQKNSDITCTYYEGISFKIWTTKI